MIPQNDSDNLFSRFTTDYDRMINWEDRLRREAPFFDRVFRENGAASVLDAACGTGRHAVMFCSRGLDVAAADVSPEMIATAEKNALAAGCRINFAVAGLEELDLVFNPGFDVITCMGNSLPHLKQSDGLGRAFDAAGRILNERGLLVLQVRNYKRIYDRNERFMPLNHRVEGNREYLYLRMSELGDSFVTFNIIKMVKDEAGKWSYWVETERLKPWMAEDIEPALKDAGFKAIESYGDFAFTAFDPSESTDLIVIARKN